MLMTALLGLYMSVGSTLENERLAMTYFYRGYLQMKNGNYADAIIDFSHAYSMGREGHYGELAYLYLGYAYAHLYKGKGDRQGLMSTLAYLHMYPHHYKKPNYLLLYQEIVGDTYLFMGNCSAARIVFSDLYGKTGWSVHLLKTLYAEALCGGVFDITLIGTVDPSTLGDQEYLLFLTEGLYFFNTKNFREALILMKEAKSVNRELEEDPHFLYRYAVAHYMAGDWRSSLSYFEMLKRVDKDSFYGEQTDYYLALIHLQNNNFVEARAALGRLVKRGVLQSTALRLIISQLWLYEDFLKAYKRELAWYDKYLSRIAWLDKEKVYSIPAVLGLYYLSLRRGTLLEPYIMREKSVPLKDDILWVGDLVVKVGPMYAKLRSYYLNPYRDEEYRLMKELYSANAKNYTFLWGTEGLVRGAVFHGDGAYFELVDSVDEPIKDFLRAQIMLLQDKEEGLKVLEKVLYRLKGEDLLEAKILLGLMTKRRQILEDLPLKDIRGSIRLSGYVPTVLLTLADLYYKERNYGRSKEMCMEYTEVAPKNGVYWLCLYRVAKISSMQGDEKTLRWVLEQAKEGQDPVAKAILTLYGE
ncbi:Tetratricopeptide repeat protein [Thermocrinis albus DSM 14484]|uniref:Tetratricopeptide repeat protein n=2 Tax=Thermocrinis TaxID=75905 RepID=D3SQ46_THEAH|nr:Tetratricopeptide repeat protein [Thermocrinis albus DSM 14484]